MPNYAGKKRKNDTDVVRAIRRAMTPSLSRQKQLTTFKAKADAPERKVIDLIPAVYPIDEDGDVTCVNLIAQGSDYNERIGRKVTIVAIQMEGHIHAASNLCPPGKCRIMFIWDSQPNGVLATPAQIFQNIVASSFMNLNFRDRFKVLMDHNVALNGFCTAFNNTIVTNASEVENISFYKRLYYPTIYSGTTATIADIQSGALLMFCTGEHAAGDAFQLVAGIRLRYIDS